MNEFQSTWHVLIFSCERIIFSQLTRSFPVWTLQPLPFFDVKVSLIRWSPDFLLYQDSRVFWVGSLCLYVYMCEWMEKKLSQRRGLPPKNNQSARWKSPPSLMLGISDVIIVYICGPELIKHAWLWATAPGLCFLPLGTASGSLHLDDSLWQSTNWRGKALIFLIPLSLCLLQINNIILQ